MVSHPLLSVWRPAAVLLLLLVPVTLLTGDGPLLTAAGATSPVAISVSPTTSFEPANVRVQVSVELDPENRGVRITADSDSYYSSSEILLDGDRGPRIRTLILRALPAGEYDVRGEVIGQDGRVRGMAHARAVIIGR